MIRTRIKAAPRGALRSDSVPERTTRDRKSGATPGAATNKENTLKYELLSSRIDAIVTKLDKHPPIWRAFALRLIKRWLERDIPAWK